MISATAYFDDSGTDEANPWLVVAGFVADVHQWERFTKEWDEVLGLYGVPRGSPKSGQSGSPENRPVVDRHPGH